ncbi:hypothetical protein [Nocardia vaccinii]|uniref:hypothetical protein n=1 Tax=Nocardia vaccinii TaxID=1822 RepID=UPI00082FE600|nr:hypothetical protein [Nocardia vaccinii]
MTPHTAPGADTEDEHGWGWLATTTAPPIPLRPSTSAAPPTDGDTEWEWLADPTPHTTPATAARPRIRLRTWVIAGLAVTALAGAATGAILTWHTGNQQTAQVATTTPDMAVAPVSPACAGLTGVVVTDRAGDTGTVAGLIATFEFDYYTRRSADEAMRTVAADSGIVPQALAGGIASIPPGTRHCVAINLLSGGAADVHVVELHPDHSRVDYLQLINTRRTPAGLAISTIQGRQ